MITRAAGKPWKNSATVSLVIGNCPSISVSPPQAQNAVEAPLVTQIRSHRQTIQLGRSPPRCCSFPALADIAFGSSFSASFPHNSAITSLVSRCTETRDLSCFLHCSLFVDELLFFLKVDLLINCDCT